MPLQVMQVGLVLGPLDGATAFVAAHSSRYLVEPSELSGWEGPCGVYERRADGRFWWVGWQ